MKEKLVVTNYDNFKTADFFIEQYFKAQDMLKEVNDFFDSFIQSKLFTSSQIRNLNPSYLGNHSNYSSDFIWTLNFISRSMMDKGYDRKIRYKYNKSKDIYEDKDSWFSDKPMTVDEFKLFKDNLANNCKKICTEISNILENTEYDCYYVLTQNNSLEEFIPIASKNTIKFDFKKDSDVLIISGSFYHYHEWGAQWGKSESELEKITKKIYVDKKTNNVIKVETEDETVKRGNADGKSYWDSHSNYCISDMTKKAINTRSFLNVKEEIRYYLLHNAKTHTLYNCTEEQKEKYFKEDLEYIHKHYDDKFEKIYKYKLTDEYIKQINKYL